MPTGYTEDIYNGKNITFEQFALKCARAFGACAHQRDEDMNKPPTLRKPDIEYYEEALKKAKEFKKPTKAEYDLYISKEKIDLENRIEQGKKLAIDYTAMMKLVKNWNPPTKEHDKFKQFMLEQLDSSLKFDCHPEHHELELAKLKRYTYQLYCKTLKYNATRDIRYYKEQIAKEKAGAKKTNKWLTELFKSLK